MTIRAKHLTLPAALLLFALPAATALAKPTASAPAHARVGDTIHITAHGLTNARNAVTLVLDDAVAERVACVARLGIAPSASTSVDVRAKIPAKLTCWTNGVVRNGTIATSPGKYHIVIAKPTGPAGFSTTPARRAITIDR